MPDERLAKLAALENSGKVVPTTIEFVDIAGLIAGAHKGEGLGNKFLAKIREVDAIMEVVRFFEDKDIIHVSESVDPLRDVETIAIELGLADLEMVGKRLETLQKDVKSGAAGAGLKKSALEKIQAVLAEGKMAKDAVLTDEEAKVLDIQLLTNKPFLFVANVAENKVKDFKDAQGGKKFIPISAKIVKGFKCTSTPGIKDDLINAGAIWSDEPVVIDRNQVTSRRPDDLPYFCEAIIKVLLAHHSY